MPMGTGSIAELAGEGPMPSLAEDEFLEPAEAGPSEDFMEISKAAFPDMDDEHRMMLYEAIRACL